MNTYVVWILNVLHDSKSLKLIFNALELPNTALSSETKNLLSRSDARKVTVIQDWRSEQLLADH